MAIVKLEDAQARLSELIDKLVPGEELLITRNDHVVARLIRQLERTGEPPRLGAQMGSVLYMAPDFDAPLELKESNG